MPYRAVMEGLNQPMDVLLIAADLFFDESVDLQRICNIVNQNTHEIIKILYLSV